LKQKKKWIKRASITITHIKFTTIGICTSISKKHAINNIPDDATGRVQKAPVFLFALCKKNDYEKTCTKKHARKNTKNMYKKHVRKNNRFFLCFYFFSSAENNREKQGYRKNKGAENKSTEKTNVQKKTIGRKKHDPKKHFTI
jgi:hypothetical protein